MEKVEVLIERLTDQYKNKASQKQLRITAQLLLSELEKESDEDLQQNSYQSVSVFFPSSSRFNTVEEIAEEKIIIPEIKIEEKIIAPPPEIKTEVVQPAPVIKPEKEETVFFDPMIEIPTLALKQQEVNETISANGESLNDKLKLNTTYKEVGSSIKSGAIKDLRKAIGINDQYLFINELFRGDQTMYERSIKTINSFNIYGEAEFWMKRELKLKLAWPEDSEVVQLFDQLVKRRFA